MVVHHRFLLLLDSDPEALESDSMLKDLLNGAVVGKPQTNQGAEVLTDMFFNPFLVLDY